MPSILDLFLRVFELNCCVYFRWQNIQGGLSDHRQKLATALEIHAFNRDVDDINERINEKVGRVRNTGSIFGVNLLAEVFVLLKIVKFL